MPFLALRRFVWLIVQELGSARTVRILGAPVQALLRLVRPRRVALADARGLLVVRLDRIGDAVLTSPLLRELRRSSPRAEITLVVRPGVADLFAHSPHVDRVLVFDPEADGAFRDLKLHLRAIRFCARSLWRRRIDFALLPRLDADLYHGTFLMYFSGASRRVGYSESTSEGKAAKNQGYDGLLTDLVPAVGVRHEVDCNLDLLTALGGSVEQQQLELTLSESARGFAARFWETRGWNADAYVVAIGVGASHARRIWPSTSYAEVLSRLASTRPVRVILLGSAAEESLGQEVSRRLGGIAENLVGRTTLQQAAALLSRCDLYLGNDTGTMHLAAAVGTPVVAVSCHPRTGLTDHPNSPLRFGPWGVPNRVLQPETGMPPCGSTCEADHAHCVTRVSVESVLHAVLELRSANGAARTGRAGGGPTRATA